MRWLSIPPEMIEYPLSKNAWAKSYFFSSGHTLDDDAGGNQLQSMVKRRYKNLGISEYELAMESTVWWKQTSTDVIGLLFIKRGRE